MNLNSFSIITNDILVNFLWINKEQAKSKIAYYEKVWKIVKIKRGYYFNLSSKISKEAISNSLFPSSYVSLETVLFNEWMIKQFSNSIQSVSNKTKTEEVFFGDIKFSNYNIKINTEEWIYINENNIWVATKERALLDIIYLRIYSSKYTIDSEIYLKEMDEELINKLLPYYSKRVSNFYYKNIKWQSTIF